MSHKRKPENIAFSITVTPDKKKKFEDEDKRTVAVLAPFNPFPKVSFENVKLHSTVVHDVYLVNPTESPLQVELTKLPEEERGYGWSATDLELPRESQVKLVISWTPSVYGSWHDNIKIVNKRTKKTLSELKLSSTTEEPPKFSKKGPKPRSAVIKKSNTGSIQKRVAVEKSTGINNLENKENESIFISKFKKQRQSGVCKIENENVTISVLKRPFQNKTFTQIDENSEFKHIGNFSETNPGITDTLSQNFNKLGPMTLRRNTYDVVGPVISTRRSTYSLNNRIVDVEKEKKLFDSLASPGIHNKSIEIAASKLIPEKESLREVDEVEPLEDACSQTFTVNPSLTYNIVSTKDPSATYSVYEVPSSPLVTIPLHMSPMSSKMPTNEAVKKLSLDSVTNSEKFYDSLEGRQSLDSLERCQDQSTDLFCKWDELFDFDKLPRTPDSSRTCKPFSEEVQASNSSFQSEFPYKNITQRKINCNFQSLSALSHKNSDSPAHLASPQKLNQTKDTLLQFDQDFGKFNSSIPSSSPVVSQSTLGNNLNKTFTPIKYNSEKTIRLEKNIEDDGALFLSSNLGKEYNTDIFKESTYHMIKTESNTSNIEETNGLKNYVTGIKKSPEVEDTGNSLLRANQNRIGNCIDASDSKQVLKWSISPPLKNIEDKNTNEKMSCPLSRTPCRFKKSSTYLGSRTHITPLTLQQSLQGNFKNEMSTHSACSLSRTKPGNKNSGNDKICSEGVFLVPQVKVKRSSLQKTFNVSPKIKKSSHELKVKRLSTPSTARKIPLSSMTERKYKMDTSCYLPRSATVTRKGKSFKVAEWVPAIRKLQLCSTSSQSEEEVSPVDVSTPDPFLAATTLNPFAKGGLYLSNKWLKEQEAELLQWTDRMLQPPNELQLDRDQSDRSTLHRLNALRAAAFSILMTTEVATVLCKVKQCVEKNIISIRSDRQLHADLGLQNKIITLLMSYNPLWLRLSLEAVYQCDIQLRCHSDKAGLRDFIRKYVLNDLYLRQTYAHPTVPHLMLPQFEEEMKKFTVYKFLVIVYLLDLIKCKKVILHDPCLFTKDSELKSSKEILIEFNKDFVAGAGDITRILRMKGYEVSHCQTYIDEFDFSLSSIKELRDGVRLTRLTENLVSDNTLCSKLRVPAVSNLQKKFNAEVAFSAIRKAGYDIPSDISPKDISDGHSEKTFSLLWHLREIFQKRAVLIIITKWRETKQLRTDRKHFLKLRNSAIKIQRWFRRVKKNHSLSGEEMKKGREARECFLKLKAVVVKIQKNFRKKREDRELKRKWQAATKIQKWYRNQKRVINDRNNFKVVKQAVITIQKTFRHYKSKKNGSELKERKFFLKIREVTVMIQRKFRSIQLAKHQRQHFLDIKTAAIKIQRRFRANIEAKNQRNKFLTIKKAIISLQRRFKALLLTKKRRNDFLKKRFAAIVIQKRYREFKQTKFQRKKFIEVKTATIKIQSKFRSFVLTKRQRENFLETKAAVITIQRMFRANREARRCRENFVLVKKASVTLQRKFRAYLVAKAQRNDFLEKKRAAILIQRRFRSYEAAKYHRKQFLMMKSALVIIQRRFRAYKDGKTQREQFLTLQNATVIIQRRFRQYLSMKYHRECFLAKRKAAVVIQRRFRSNQTAKYHRRQFLKMKAASVIIQRRFKTLLITRQLRQHFLKKRFAATLIQKRFREYIQTKFQRKKFVRLKIATVKIQRRFRANRETRRCRENFVLVKKASVTLQKKFRAYLVAKAQRNYFLEKKRAAILIQRRFRSKEAAKYLRKEFLMMKSASVIIQRRFRAYKDGKTQREQFLTLKNATIIIQRRFRQYLSVKYQMECFIAKKKAAVIIQRRYREYRLAKLQRIEFINMRNATLVIQRQYRNYKQTKIQREYFISIMTATIFIQKSFRSLQIAKKERKNFLLTKTAAVTVQRMFRANQEMKKYRNRFITVKKAVITIQRKFRARKLCNTERKQFVALKSATIMIQRRFRAIRLAIMYREAFLLMRKAAVVIQTRFRVFLCAKFQKQEFIRTKTAAIILQRRFRAYKQGKKQRENLCALKKATINIQRRFRAKKIVNYYRQQFISLRNATIYIQRLFRAKKVVNPQRLYFTRLRAAAIVIQRKFRDVQVARSISEQPVLTRKTNAALQIQAAWRGYMVRKTVSIPKTKPTNLEESKINQPISARGQSYFRILANHHKYTVAELLNTLINIDKITVISAHQCEYYVRNGAVRILYAMLEHQSNRAYGVQSCVERILMILINLYRAPATADTVWKETIECHGVFDVFDLLMRFRTEKIPTIFCNACTLIWLFAQDPVKAQVMMNQPQVQEMYKYVVKTMKKNELPSTAGSKKNIRKPLHSRLTTRRHEEGTSKKFPALRFNWGAYFDDIRAFEDKSLALNSVIEKLGRFEKK